MAGSCRTPYWPSTKLWNEMVWPSATRTAWMAIYSGSMMIGLLGSAVMCRRCHLGGSRCTSLQVSALHHAQHWHAQHRLERIAQMCQRRLTFVLRQFGHRDRNTVVRITHDYMQARISGSFQIYIVMSGEMHTCSKKRMRTLRGSSRLSQSSSLPQQGSPQPRHFAAQQRLLVCEISRASCDNTPFSVIQSNLCTIGLIQATFVAA